MTIEREFLKKLRYASLLENDLRKELEELLAQPEKTEQEPVAWMWDEMFCEDWTTVSSVIKPSKSKYVDNVRPLYLAPPKREPLSTDTMLRLITEHRDFPLNLARAVERECGIGGGE
jgi:hypothetical protein